MSGGAVDYTGFLRDPRIAEFYKGATVCGAHLYGERHYKRRKRCDVCGELSTARAQMKEGMACGKCATQLIKRPLKQVYETYGGFAMIRYEYEEASE